MRRFVVLFLLAWTLSCGVKQPVTQPETQQFGRIAVTSTPSGGLIYLDNRNSSLTTPDTLTQISQGSHSIRIVLPEYQAIPESINVNVEPNNIVSAHFQLKKLERIGFVFISSAPAGADILIDNRQTGKTTPDTVQLEAGSHTITVHKNGYVANSSTISVQQDTTRELSLALDIQKCVLLEAFGNVSCTPCVDAAHNLHTFEENFPQTDYAIIEYYANWPSPNDPFYKQAPDDVMQRLQYYRLTSLPSLVFGGTLGVDATQYAEIKQAFLATYSGQSPTIGLSITKQLVDGELNVAVESTSANPEDLETCVLFVAIVENQIHFDAPPGSNGLTDFDFVFRGFLSGRSGDAFDTRQHQQFSYTFEWPDWNYSNCNIIAFIQHTKTQQILHTAIN